MGTENKTILTINAGSSSVKLAVFTDSLELLLEATVTGIGEPSELLILRQPASESHTQSIHSTSQKQAATIMLETIANELPINPVAIGFRVVHGGSTFNSPVIVTTDVISQLKQITYLDPEHAQATIDLLEIFGQHFPQAIQVACFDTAFYRDLPAIARLLPLPRKFDSLGLRRYGFHGLSYEFLIQKFEEMAGVVAAHGRVIFAHLGSGASLTAVKNGKPLDTTMSFTPASGILMSTRSGDLDPGIATFLNKQTGMTNQEFDHMVHFESGLLGVSDRSADMEVLIRESEHDAHAADAVDLFCYQVRKTIGSLSAVLGGLDSLVFAGGMGENAPVVREKVCESLGYLGVGLDKQRNNNHEFLISSDDSNVGVHIIHTDEAQIIASQTKQTMHSAKEGI